MPDFIESRLLDKLAFGFQGGPTWYTLVTDLQSGVQRRKALRSRPKYRYTLPYQNIDLTDTAAVIAAFNACQGAAVGFRLKDWTDYSVTAQAIGNTPGANLTPVQLYKTYTFGATTVQRPIKKPVSGTVTVYSNGTPKTGTLDTTTGLFTPTTNWTAGQALTWTGEFDVPVRFSSDELVFDLNNPGRLSANIEVEEVL